MAVLVSSMIDQAALLFGDPAKERFLPEQWLEIYNQSIREACSEFNILKREWKTDLASHVVTYPDDMKVLKSVQVALDPSNVEDFSWLREFSNEDQFRAATHQRYPQEARPSRYYADQEVVYLVGRPANVVVDGLRFKGFGLPDLVPSITGTYLETHDLLRDFVVRRMLVTAKQVNKQYAEAAAEYGIWQQSGAHYEHLIEDRADDAPKSFRPESANNPTAGMW